MNTCADLTNLREAGYSNDFMGLETAIPLAVENWNKNG
jgi:hypothetical protein